MKKQENNKSYRVYRITNILLFTLILISCEPFTSTPPHVTKETLMGSTAINTARAEATPPALPALFQSNYSNPLDTPHTYLQDSCQYLVNRWNRLNAEPGTIVMILMLRDIITSPTENNGNAGDVDINDLRKIIDQLKFQGFEAINTKQFLAFMERNVRIPPRSVLIIQDGNHDLENYDKSFREYWVRWGWPVINGWVSQINMPEELWTENVTLENEGFVDHQAQGVTDGTLLSDDSSKIVIARELQGSITPFIEQYRKNPIAFIWPNGGFGQRPVTAARLLNYQLGFTTNSRGPVMYNWVPLADSLDPERPSYTPEGAINDPLMTLPRFWLNEALKAIDQVRTTGNEAKMYAEANKAVEFEYYRIVCEPVYGPMPTP